MAVLPVDGDKRETFAKRREEEENVGMRGLMK